MSDGRIFDFEIAGVGRMAVGRNEVVSEQGVTRMATLYIELPHDQTILELNIGEELTTQLVYALTECLMWMNPTVWGDRRRRRRWLRRR